MKLGKYNVTPTEYVDELSGGPQIYAEISCEAVKEFFEKHGECPTNSSGLRDDSYVSGEVQFIFSGDNELEEVLVFPVYCDENEESFENGEDFVNIINDESLTGDVINELKEIIESKKEKELE